MAFGKTNKVVAPSGSGRVNPSTKNRKSNSQTKSIKQGGAPSPMKPLKPC